MLKNCYDVIGGVRVTTLDCVLVIIPNLIFWALEFSGFIAVIFIIIAAYNLVTSNGDAKKIDEGRKILLYAILGLVVILLSFAIVITISKITGVGCIDPSRPFSFSSCSSGRVRGGSW